MQDLHSVRRLRIIFNEVNNDRTEKCIFRYFITNNELTMYRKIIRQTNSISEKKIELEWKEKSINDVRM